MLESDLREDAKYFSTDKQNDNNIENFLESGFYSENLSIIAREIIEYNAKTARSSSDFRPFLSPLKKMWGWVTQYLTILGIIFTAATFLIGGFSILSTVGYDTNIASYLFPKIPLTQIFFESSILLSLIILIYGLGFPSILGIHRLIQYIIFETSLIKPISIYRRKSFYIYSLIFTLLMVSINIFLIIIVRNSNFFLILFSLAMLFISMPVFLISLFTWPERIALKGWSRIIIPAIVFAVGTVGIYNLWDADKIQGGQFCRYSTNPYTDDIKVYRYFITQDWADKQEILLLPGSDSYSNPISYPLRPPYKPSQKQMTIDPPDLVTVTKSEQSNWKKCNSSLTNWKDVEEIKKQMKYPFRLSYYEAYS